MENDKLLVPDVHHARGHVHHRRHDDAQAQALQQATERTEDDDTIIRSHTGQAALGQQVG